MNKNRCLPLVLFCLSGCANGDGNSDIIIEGTLIQGGSKAHTETLAEQRAFTKHAAGEPIAHVKICALESCATTNDHGQWGFGVPQAKLEQDVLFTVVGHGIDATFNTFIPKDISEAVITLHNENGQPEIHEMSVVTNDGQIVTTHEDAD